MSNKVIKLEVGQDGILRKSNDTYTNYANMFNGKKQHDTMKERSSLEAVGMHEILLSEHESAAGSSEPSSKEVSNLEITPKEYIDDQIGALEKSIDHKFDAQEKLLSEKIDHLHTKIEGTISEKLTNFKTESDRDRKEDRKFYITAAIGLAAVVVTLLGFVF